MYRSQAAPPGVRRDISGTRLRSGVKYAYERPFSLEPAGDWRTSRYYRAISGKENKYRMETYGKYVTGAGRATKVAGAFRCL